MQAKSFIEILANQLRKEIRAELELEMSVSKASLAERAAVSLKADQTQLLATLGLSARMTSTATSGFAATRKSQAYRSEKRKNSGHIARVAIDNSTSTAEVKVQEPITAERIGEVVTLEQTLAHECFKREGSSLPTRFTENDLKTQFRKIALKIHPDRNLSANKNEQLALSARFHSVVEAAKILEGIFTN